TLVNPPAPPSTFAPRMDGSFMTSATVMLIALFFVLSAKFRTILPSARFGGKGRKRYFCLHARSAPARLSVPKPPTRVRRRLSWGRDRLQCFRMEAIRFQCQVRAELFAVVQPYLRGILAIVLAIVDVLVVDDDYGRRADRDVVGV